MRQFRSGVSGPRADIENALLSHPERPKVAASRRSGDEIHPWPPNGDLRPFADDGPGKTSGRLLVLHCGAMLPEVDQQLGKIIAYPQPSSISPGSPSVHLTVG